MKPGEVLDAQGDLLTRAQGHNFAAAMLPLLTLDFDRGENGASEAAAALGKEFSPERYTKRMVQLVTGSLRSAYAYKVSPDMCDLIEFAATKLDDTDVFDRSLAPTGSGFVYFEKPFSWHNHRGRKILVHWLLWGPGSIDEDGEQAALSVFMFNDLWKQPDEAWLALQDSADTEEIRAKVDRLSRVFGRFSMVNHGWPCDGDPLGPAETDLREELASDAAKKGYVPTTTTNWLRYLHALFLMLDQTVTVVEKETPERAYRRRAIRMNLPPEVTVIRLRRESSGEHQEHGESQVVWQHRWFVRGHWRWQACGPGRTERVRIWINPFMKGPEDAPLKQSEKVFSLER